MKRIGAALMLAVLGLPAAAQDAPRNFPLDRAFRVISISGFDVQRSGLTLTVKRDGSRFAAAGSAGCNTWNASFIFRDDAQFDVTEIVATRKHCGGARMKTEDAFLTTLRSAHRWRLDEKKRLILEGEVGRLLLTSAPK